MQDTPLAINIRLVNFHTYHELGAEATSYNDMQGHVQCVALARALAHAIRHPSVNRAPRERRDPHKGPALGDGCPME
uniref:Uncharacterized protein n=1 Tax=Oryza punctata TaxID=4537 RepID=A0A0E0KEC6_ORYPU